MLISLVGLSGSGKSYISTLLSQYNEKIIKLDIDKIGHQATEDETIKQKLVEHFGIGIIENNQIVRSRLSAIVFKSREAMDILTNLTWEYMERVIDAFIECHPANIIILDWLLLPKTKYFSQSDLRVLVTASQETRLNRVIKRDGVTAEKFFSREASAPTINQEEFEYIIENEDLEKTKKEVERLYDKSIIHRKF